MVLLYFLVQNNNLILLQKILTITLLPFCATLSTTNSKNNRFDLQSFLDPQIIQSVIPLPVSFPNSHVQKPVAVIEPPNQQSFAGSIRQLSLAPTTAFISRRSFNTSCAFTIPLFTFTLTQSAPFNEDNSVNIANQMVYFLFAVLYSTASFVVPVVFSGIRDPTITGRSQGEANSEALLDRLLAPQPLVDFMGTKGLQRVGLDGRKCLLKTICVANRSNKYGLLGLPFQIFFPPPSNGTLESVSSAAQIAARMGVYQKEKDCGEVYPCLLDVLDVLVYLRDRYYLNSPS